MPFPKEAVTNADLDGLAWLAGIWQGTVNDEVVEEAWTLPQNGSLMGMFRWFRDGEIRLMEMITIADFEGEIRLKIKQFDKSLVSWEEQDKTTDFILVQLSPNLAAFVEDGKEQWLIYKREGDKMTVHFERQDGPPAVKAPFEYNLMSRPTS